MQKILKLQLMVLLFLLAAGSSLAQKKAFRAISLPDSIKKDNKKVKVIATLLNYAKGGKVTYFAYDHLDAGDAEFTINFLPKGPVKAVRDEVEANGELFTWYGHLEESGKRTGTIVLVFSNGVMSGNINYFSSNYSINPLGKGVSLLYEIDFSKAPKDHPKYDNNKGDASLGANNSSLSTSSLNSTPACRVRVLVAYTGGAETGAITNLGFANMRQYVQQAIAETNQSYINSNVTHRVELAAAIRVSYTETGDHSTDLNRFQGTSDGFMDEVHTYRTQYSADICALIFNNDQYCGMAATIGATTNNAFCVVHYINCALGNYSFGHEIAHLHGCRHNNDTGTTPYPYGHGFCSVANGWRTIMGVNGSCDAARTSTTRIQYYSNPDVLYNGVATGTVATHDNARALDVSAPTVAAYVNPVASLSIGANGSLVDNEIGDAVATTSIVLTPGFEVRSNSQFRGYIATGCSGGFAASRVASDKEGANNPNASRKLASVSPNPSNGIFTLSFNDLKDEKVQIQVVDVFGKSVYYKAGVSPAGNHTVNLKQHPSGIYLVKVTSGTETTEMRVVVLK